MDNGEQDAMLLLNLASGLGPVLTRRCVQAMGSSQAVTEASIKSLSGVRGIGRVRAEGIRRALDELQDGQALAREKQLIAQHGVTVLSLGEAGYPQLLKHTPDPPMVLYVRGQLREDDALAVAVVGTRRCTAYGREQAQRLSVLCAQAGLCVVSGGARGIDAASHRATLRVKGRTIAVLGSGLAKSYPPEHDELFDTIAEGGAVVSELPMLAPPQAENFPRRNRIISGLALGVLVIEAPIDSGAMITARLAVEDHGREVMALPGRVDSRNSAGCHKMIREGWATLVTSAAEVLDALGEAGQLLKAGLRQEKNDDRPKSFKHGLTEAMTEPQRQVFEALNTPQTLDQLVAQTGLEVSTVQAQMTLLEVRGLAVREGGLCRQREPVH